MKLHQLIKIKTKSKKRLGRGIGSGRGKTAGRGTKGQKARGKIPAAAVGGGLVFYKKLPFRRGLKNKRLFPKVVGVNLNKLNIYRNKETVDLESLISKKLISERETKKGGIKILSSGELKVALTVKVPTSQNAKEAIEKKGGKVV